MIGAWRKSRAGAGWFSALAALALLVQVLIPQGFMASGDARSHGLVICTGHGPLLNPDNHGKPGKAPRSAAEAPCGFASHGGAAGPTPSFALAAARFDYVALPAARRLRAVPGRGLAAPPPPSQAPPALT
jgi:hypothetical protein